MGGTSGSMGSKILLTIFGLIKLYLTIIVLYYIKSSWNLKIIKI